MLYLSQAIGRPVLDANGEPLGKVDDLIVAVGDRYPPVTGLVVVTDRRRDRGLHSGRVAAMCLDGPSTPRGQHIPVDDGPSPTGGERAAPIMKPVRPAS